MDIEIDIFENFINLDFTQNYSNINYVIKNIKATNNGKFNKDILPLLELTLNKTWKSNAKLAIFVTDLQIKQKELIIQNIYLMI